MQSESSSASPKESTVLSTQREQSSSTQHGKHHISVPRSAGSSYGVQSDLSHIAAIADINDTSSDDEDSKARHNLNFRLSAHQGALDTIVVDRSVPESSNIPEYTSAAARSGSTFPKDGLHITELPNGVSLLTE